MRAEGRFIRRSSRTPSETARTAAEKGSGEEEESLAFSVPRSTPQTLMVPNPVLTTYRSAAVAIEILEKVRPSPRRSSMSRPSWKSRMVSMPKPRASKP